MQARYPASFDREMGCTEREWLAWLPGAVQAHALKLAQGRADVAIGRGKLQLCWQALAPRQIALVRLPRLAVQFRFDEGVTDDERRRFMRLFDLSMQRGGG